MTTPIKTPIKTPETPLKIDDSKTNGLITKIWGPHFWEVLHFVSFGYPLEPTPDNKKDYKEFYLSVRNVLPCRYCRESYSDFILKEDRTKLTDKDLENRDSLTRWVYKLHERVNEKIGIHYKTTYEDVFNKYETLRAKCMPAKKSCNMPIYLKANSYKIAEIKQAPVIDTSLYDAIKKYAKLRDVEFDKDIHKLLNLPRSHKSWQLRDKLCWKIIKKMRNEGIASVEKDGPYKNLPTVYELKLLALLSTNICCTELNEIVDNIKKLL